MFSDDPAPRLPTTPAERWTLAVTAGVLVALMVAEVASGFTQLKLSILFALLAWVPLLVLHELGHALAARMVGWRVSEIVIGFGRELARFRVGETRVRLLAAPIEGYVVPSPSDTRHARLKSAWIYAAGPGIELLYVGLCWAWYGPRFTTPGDDLWLLLVQSSCLAAVMGALFNLLPYASDHSSSDGLGIITSLAAKDENFRSQLATPFVRHARSELLQGSAEKAKTWTEFGLAQYPEDWQLRATQAVCLAAEGQADAAVEQLEALGDLDQKPLGVKVELLLDAAWTVLFSQDLGQMLNAQRACERALTAYPGHVRGCLLLGRVLLERGRPEAALVHLMAGYKLTRDQDYEAQLVTYLAVAYLRAGEREYAERFLEEAKRLKLPANLRLEVQRMETR